MRWSGVVRSFLFLLPALLPFSSLTFAAVSPRLDAPLCSTTVHLQSPSAVSVDGFPAAGVTVQLDAWGDDSIRIRMAVEDDIQQIPYVQALLPFPPGLTPPPSTPLPCSTHRSRKQTGLVADLSNGNIGVQVNDVGIFTVKRLSDGATLVTASNIDFSRVSFPSSVYQQNYSLWALSIDYTHAAGTIFGLGEHKTNRTAYDDYSHLFETSQEYGLSGGGDISIPFYISTAGFGLLYNQAGYGYVHITPEKATWGTNATHQLDVWVTTSPAKSTDVTPYPAISSHYADATGHPNLLPHFASGFWQSKDRYRNQSELLEVARHFHAIGVQLGVLVIDWQHWHYLGDWTFYNPTCWPDPTAMVKEISSYGTHTMISAWPRVDPQSSHYPDMHRLGYLTHNANGTELISASGSEYIYDAFQPAAREYFWKALLEGYVTHGIQLFWLDAAEPEQSTPGLQWWDGHSDLEVGMAWVIKHLTMIYEGSLTSGIPQDQVISLSRHGWVGAPLLNAFVWSGDTASTWDSFQVQVKMAPNVQLSGLHWWATDIGGYFGGQYSEGGFNELLVRWFQWGAFLPIFRVHGHREPSETGTECGGGGGPNELWTYQHEAEIAAVIALREIIRPYVEYHLRVASMTGVPILQTMWYNFTDPQCLDVAAETQFMFGPTFLVAPVLAPLGSGMSTGSRSVYLPRVASGEVWVHFYTGQVYQGGAAVQVNYTLATFPLFQRLPSMEAHAGIARAPVRLREEGHGILRGEKEEGVKSGEDDDVVSEG